MNENFATNDSKNNDFSQKTDDFDYENLITRLKKISENISLLEKTITK